MSILLYANNANTTLQSNITSSQSTITVATGTGGVFPTPSGNSYFYVTLTDSATETVREICLCVSRTGDVLTVQRAQQGTTANTFVAGDYVAQLVTGGDLNNLIQIDQLQSGKYTFATGGGTANSITATLNTNFGAPFNGLALTVTAPAANTGAATLTLTMGSTVQPAYSIVKNENQPLVANDIPGANFPIELVWSSAFAAFVMTNPATSVVANIAGGAAHEILVQTASGATGFIPAPTGSGQVLVGYNGSDITWQSAAVTSFNGRAGAVTPQTGDYTADQVGAVSTASVTGANQQLANTGYQVLPGGLIIQWGSATVPQPSTITFPLAFPNACFMVVGSNNWDQSGITSAVFGWTQTYFQCNRTYNLSWIAIGN